MLAWGQVVVCGHYWLPQSMDIVCHALHDHERQLIADRAVDAVRAVPVFGRKIMSFVLLSGALYQS